MIYLHFHLFIIITSTLPFLSVPSFSALSPPPTFQPVAPPPFFSSHVIRPFCIARSALQTLKGSDCNKPRRINQSSRWNMSPTSLNKRVLVKERGRLRVGFGWWKYVRAFVFLLMCGSGCFFGRCMSFCLTGYQRVKLPFITSIMQG